MGKVELELTQREADRAIDLYRQHGDNPQQLAQDIWREMQTLDQDPKLKNNSTLKENIKESFLHSMEIISHDHSDHKTALVTLTETAYDHVSNKPQQTYHAGEAGYEYQILIGTNDSKILGQKSWGYDMKSLDEFAKPDPKIEATAKQNSQYLYDYLGPNHSNLDNFRQEFGGNNHRIASNGQNEAEKITRDRAMEMFREKANDDKSCPFRFELDGLDQDHYEGFKIFSKKTGKQVDQVLVPRPDATPGS